MRLELFFACDALCQKWSDGLRPFRRFGPAVGAKREKRGRKGIWILLPFKHQFLTVFRLLVLYANIDKLLIYDIYVYYIKYISLYKYLKGIKGRRNFKRYKSVSIILYSLYARLFALLIFGRLPRVLENKLLHTKHQPARTNPRHESELA